LERETGFESGKTKLFHRTKYNKINIITISYKNHNSVVSVHLCYYFTLEIQPDLRKFCERILVRVAECFPEEVVVPVLFNGNEIALALCKKGAVAPNDIYAGYQVGGASMAAKAEERDVNRFNARPTRARPEWDV